MKKLILLFTSFFLFFLSFTSISAQEIDGFQRTHQFGSTPLFSFNDKNKDNIYYLFPYSNGNTNNPAQIKKQNGEVVFEFPPFISNSLSVFQTKNGYIFSYYRSYYGKYDKFTLLYYDFETDSFSLQTLPFKNPLKNNVLNAYMRDGYMYLYRYTPKKCSSSSGCYGPYNQYYKISLDSSVNFETIDNTFFNLSNLLKLDYGNIYNIGNEHIQFLDKKTKTFKSYIYNNSENTIFLSDISLNFQSWFADLSDYLTFWTNDDIQTTKLIVQEDNKLIASFQKGDKVFSCFYLNLSPGEGQKNCTLKNDRFIFDIGKIRNDYVDTAFSVPANTTLNYEYHNSNIAPIVNIKYIDGQPYYYYVDDVGDLYFNKYTTTYIYDVTVGGDLGGNLDPFNPDNPDSFDLSLITGIDVTGGTNFNNLENIKTNGEGYLNIDYTDSSILSPIISDSSSTTCSLFNPTNLNFQYYSNGNFVFNLTLKQFDIFNNQLGSVFDFISGVFTGPINNIIGLTSITIPFTYDNQEVCLLGEVKTITFHKMMTSTEYYGKMTIFDYIVLLVYASFLFAILGGTFLLRGSSYPSKDFDFSKPLKFSRINPNRLPGPKTYYKSGEYKIYRD